MIMFEFIAGKIVSFQVKFPKRFLLVFLLLNVLFIPGIFKLTNNVEPSLEKVLPQDVPEIQTMNYMRSEFGADMIYLVVYTKDGLVDVRDPEYLRYVDILSNKILTRENVVGITSISSLAKSMNGGQIPASLESSRELFSMSPQTLSFADSSYSFSVVKIQTTVGASAQIVDKLIVGINDEISFSDEFNPGTYTQVTGFPAIDRATFNVIMSDFAFITIVSMIGVGIVVFFTFKSFVRGMLPMVVVINSLIWTMGMVGYLGLTITVVSMVAAAMIMGLGIDFGIHEVHSYFEARKRMSAKKALDKVLKELLRAMVGASLTTIAGFLALLFGVLPAMKVLGVILALGILNTLIGAIFLLPVLIYIYDVNYEKKMKSRRGVRL